MKKTSIPESSNLLIMDAFHRVLFELIHFTMKYGKISPFVMSDWLNLEAEAFNMAIANVAKKHKTKKRSKK